LVERVERLAGVQSVSLASHLPLGEDHTSIEVLAEGENRDGHGIPVDDAVVGPKYFKTLRIPILRGRDFSEADSERSPGVIIINEAMAKRWWPGQDPVGRRLSTFRVGFCHFLAEYF
jgi:hypothetical protein